MHGAGGWTGSQQHLDNTQCKSQARAFPRREGGERGGWIFLQLRIESGSCKLGMGQLRLALLAGLAALPLFSHLPGAPLPPSKGWHSQGMAALIPSALGRDPQHPKLLLSQAPGAVPGWFLHPGMPGEDFPCQFPALTPISPAFSPLTSAVPAQTEAPEPG